MQKKVLEPVSEKIWYQKSPRTGLGENLVPKKVPEPVLFSFGYTNIDISNDNNWGGWWGFGTARIAEISVFLLKSLLYHV